MQAWLAHPRLLRIAPPGRNEPPVLLGRTSQAANDSAAPLECLRLANGKEASDSGSDEGPPALSCAPEQPKASPPESKSALMRQVPQDLPATLAQKAQQDVQEARNALESTIVKEAAREALEWKVAAEQRAQEVTQAKKSTDKAIKKLEEAKKQLAEARGKVTRAEARANAAEKQAFAGKDRASAAEQKLESVKQTVRSEAQQDASRLVKTVEQELQRKDLLLNEAKAQLRRLMQESEASEKRRKELQEQVDLLRQEQEDEVEELQMQLAQARAINREFRQQSVQIIERLKKSLLQYDMHLFRAQFGERSTPPQARPALSSALSQGIHIPLLHGERPMPAAAFWQSPFFDQVK